MNQRGWVFVGLAVVIGAVVAWRVAVAVTAPPEVIVRTLKEAPATRLLAIVGRIRNASVVDIRPEQPGKAVELLVDEGASVVKGQPLAIIAADQPRAQIAAAQANVTGQAAALDQAKRDLARTQTLAAKGFAAPAAVEDRRTAVRTATALLAAAQANVANADSLTRKYTILSPAAGRILVRPIDEGQVVESATVLFQLGSGAPEVWAEADEALADAVTVGQMARLSASGTAVTVDGTVIEVSPRVDASTGGRIIRLAPTGAGLTGVAGRSVDVNVIVDQRDRALTVPRAALLPGRATQTVFVVVASSVQERTVGLIDWPSPDAIVTGGLKAGDRLVLAPGKLKAGQRIKALEAPR